MKQFVLAPLLLAASLIHARSLPVMGEAEEEGIRVCARDWVEEYMPNMNPEQLNTIEEFLSVAVMLPAFEVGAHAHAIGMLKQLFVLRSELLKGRSGLNGLVKLAQAEALNDVVIERARLCEVRERLMSLIMEDPEMRAAITQLQSEMMSALRGYAQLIQEQFVQEMTVLTRTAQEGPKVAHGEIEQIANSLKTLDIISDMLWFIDETSALIERRSVEQSTELMDGLSLLEYKSSLILFGGWVLMIHQEEFKAWLEEN